METTLSDGDNLIVDKLTYHFKDPERFDIIVFPYKYEENTYYIKRIIGMPGETIQIMGGYVYINGQQLTSDIYGADWGRMSILSWGTTGTTVRTAESRM